MKTAVLAHVWEPWSSWPAAVDAPSTLACCRRTSPTHSRRVHLHLLSLCIEFYVYIMYVGHSTTNFHSATCGHWSWRLRVFSVECKHVLIKCYLRSNYEGSRFTWYSKRVVAGHIRQVVALWRSRYMGNVRASKRGSFPKVVRGQVSLYSSFGQNDGLHSHM